MIKKMTWIHEHQFISGGNCCSLMKPTSEKSRDFTTEGISCLSPDGTLLVLREQDQMIRVRKVVREEWRTGDVLFSCQQLPAEQVLGFAWSPDSKMVAIQLTNATHTYQARSGWSSKRGQQCGVYRIESLLQQEQALVFAPRTKRIAQALQAGGVVLWETDTGTLFRDINSASVLSMAWSPSERYLALGTDDSLGIYLVRSGRLLRQWTGQPAEVRALAWSPDGMCLVSGDQQGRLLRWNTRGNAEAWDCAGHVEPAMKAGIEACAWSHDGTQVAVLDSQDQQQLGIFDIFPSRQEAIAF